MSIKARPTRKDLLRSNGRRRGRAQLYAICQCRWCAHKVKQNKRFPPGAASTLQTTEYSYEYIYSSSQLYNKCKE